MNVTAIFRPGDRVRALASANKQDWILSEGDELEVVLGPWDKGAFTKRTGEDVYSYGLKVINMAPGPGYERLKEDRERGITVMLSALFGFEKAVEIVLTEDVLEPVAETAV